MEQYFLLTYVNNDVEFDLINQVNLDQIQVMAVNAHFVDHLQKNIEEKGIKVIGLEPYSVLKFKIDIVENFIKTNT